MYIIFGTWGQQLSIHYRDLNLLPAEADEFIQEEEEGRWDQVDVKAWLLEEGKAAMDHCLPGRKGEGVLHYLIVLPQTATHPTEGLSNYSSFILTSI